MAIRTESGIGSSNSDQLADPNYTLQIYRRCIFAREIIGLNAYWTEPADFKSKVQVLSWWNLDQCCYDPFGKTRQTSFATKTLKTRGVEILQLLTKLGKFSRLQTALGSRMQRRHIRAA